MDMSPDEILTRNMKKLVELAARDGIISIDEHAVLDQIQISMTEYTEKMKEALEDGIITLEEVDRLKKIKEKMIKDAFDVANIDNVITSDELLLLMNFVVTIELPKPSEE